jgi:DNA invertase Pin-like site-specific DNA recombinase
MSLVPSHWNPRLHQNNSELRLITRMKVKYQRTSTMEQHGERFGMDVDGYDLILFDRGISGTKPFRERTNGMKIITMVEEGRLEELVVPELRDIGRSIYDSISVLEFFDKHNVIVTIQSLGNLQSIVDGKKNPLWTLISSIMSSLYQMELENLKLRTHMGRQSYLMRGGKLGRKMGSNENVTTFMNKPKSQEIVSLLNRGKSVRDVCGRLGVSPNLVTKVRRILREWNDGEVTMVG